MMRVVVSSFMLILLAACQQETYERTALPTATETENFLAGFDEITPFPTVALATEAASATPIPPTMIPTATNLPPIEPTSTRIPPTLTPFVVPVYEKTDHYWLQRPIAQEDDTVHWVDRTYPYGGTQFGTREVHLGVEFVNGRFTPVYASADGIVFYAGDDRAIQFGPRRDYYGNLVVVQHDFQTVDDRPVFTLYAHLQEIEVQEGQSIRAGQRVGRVGDSGIAVGPHLHFEVRAGDVYDYRSTLNPDLWIKPYPRFGTIAGFVKGVANSAGMVVQVRSETVQRETFVYGGSEVNSDIAWQENFTLGDLPADTYDVIIGNGNGRVLFRESVTILSGKTTFVEVDLAGSR